MHACAVEQCDPRAALRRRVDVAVDPLKHAVERVAVRPMTGGEINPHAMWKRASRSSTGRLPLEDGLRPEPGTARAAHMTAVRASKSPCHLLASPTFAHPRAESGIILRFVSSRLMGAVQIRHVRQLLCDIINGTLRQGVRERLAQPLALNVQPCVSVNRRPQAQSLIHLHRLELLEDHPHDARTHWERLARAFCG